MNRRTTALAGVLPLLLTLLLAACGDARGGASLATVRDSAGIRIVESSGGTWEEGEAWRVAAQPALEIGMAEGPPAYLLDQVHGARRLSNGEMVIANGGSGELRLELLDPVLADVPQPRFERGLDGGQVLGHPLGEHGLDLFEGSGPALGMSRRPGKPDRGLGFPFSGHSVGGGLGRGFQGFRD